MARLLAASILVLIAALERVEANECIVAQTEVVGRVVYSDHKTPAAHVGVWLVSIKESAIARRSRTTGAGPRNVTSRPSAEKRAVTDEQGRFSFSSIVDPADSVVHAELSSSVFTEIELNASAHAREIVLPDFCDGRGRIASWKPEWRSQLKLFYSGADVDLAGRIGSDGSFDLGPLPREAGALYVSTGLRQTFVTCMGPVDVGPPRIDLGAPYLALARTAGEVELPTAPACLQLTVKLRGKPAPGLTLTVRSAETVGRPRDHGWEAVAVTNDDGVAELGDLPAGKWTVHVSDCKTWFVPLAGPIELIPWQIVEREIDIPRASAR